MPQKEHACCLAHFRHVTEAIESLPSTMSTSHQHICNRLAHPIYDKITQLGYLHVLCTCSVTVVAGCLLFGLQAAG